MIQSSLCQLFISMSIIDIEQPHDCSNATVWYMLFQHACNVTVTSHTHTMGVSIIPPPPKRGIRWWSTTDVYSLSVHKELLEYSRCYGWTKNSQRVHNEMNKYNIYFKWYKFCNFMFNWLNNRPLQCRHQRCSCSKFVRAGFLKALGSRPCQRW